MRLSYNVMCLALGLTLSGCPLLFSSDEPFAQEPGNNDESFFVEAPVIWPMKNLFDGQTNVARDLAIQVRGIHWDPLFAIEEGATIPVDSGELPWLSLNRADHDLTGHSFLLTLDNLESGSVTIQPIDGLDADTDYFLSFPACELQPHVMCPAPIAFSTRSAPRVLGVWRAQATLIVVFSEPMDAATLDLAHDSVDLAFNDQGVTLSLVSDFNLAEFVWATDGLYFQFASITKKPFKLILGTRIRSMTGAHLDIDADGISDDTGVLVVPVEPDTLLTCTLRDDFPDPCVSPGLVRTGKTVEFVAPFEPELDIPEVDTP
jgi:hypothetical protein